MKSIIIAVDASRVGVLSGCNTVHGLGNDIDQVGDTIQYISQ